MDAQNRHQRHFHVQCERKDQWNFEAYSEAIGGGEYKMILESEDKLSPKNPMPEFSGLVHALGRGESASRGDGSLLL